MTLSENTLNLIIFIAVAVIVYSLSKIKLFALDPVQPVPKAPTKSTSMTTKERLQALQSYQFPTSVLDRFKKKYPHFSHSQVKIVTKGLKDFFALIIINPNVNIAMPSRVVDELWHAFLKNPEQYGAFCLNIVGTYVEHKESHGSVKGFNRSKPIRHVSKEVKDTCARVQRHDDYDFGFNNNIPLLFLLDTQLPVDYGYFYDSTSTTILTHPEATSFTDLNGSVPDCAPSDSGSIDAPSISGCDTDSSPSSCSSGSESSSCSSSSCSS